MLVATAVKGVRRAPLGGGGLQAWSAPGDAGAEGAVRPQAATRPAAAGPLVGQLPGPGLCRWGLREIIRDDERQVRS